MSCFNGCNQQKAQPSAFMSRFHAGLCQKGYQMLNQSQIEQIIPKKNLLTEISDSTVWLDLVESEKIPDEMKDQCFGGHCQEGRETCSIEDTTEELQWVTQWSYGKWKLDCG